MLTAPSTSPALPSWHFMQFLPWKFFEFRIGMIALSVLLSSDTVNEAWPFSSTDFSSGEAELSDWLPSPYCAMTVPNRSTLMSLTSLELRTWSRNTPRSSATSVIIMAVIAATVMRCTLCAKLRDCAIDASRCWT
jgi:hypothetical protein